MNMPVNFLCAIDIWCMQGDVGHLEGVRIWGGEGTALGQLDYPSGVVVMSSGAVWVADSANRRVCLLH